MYVCLVDDHKLSSYSCTCVRMYMYVWVGGRLADDHITS